MFETFLQGKIRVKLLTKSLLNPSNMVYLRGMEKEFEVSSNTVRVELNKLPKIKLIDVVANLDSNQDNTGLIRPILYLKTYGAKYSNNFVWMPYEKVFDRFGEVKALYSTHDWAEGKHGPFLDLLVVGSVDEVFMQELIKKAEPILNRKIRIMTCAHPGELPDWECINSVQ